MANEKEGALQAGSTIAEPHKAVRHSKEVGDVTQSEKFKQAARDLGCDDDEEAFKDVLRKLAKPKQ